MEKLIKVGIRFLPVNGQYGDWRRTIRRIGPDVLCRRSGAKGRGWMSMTVENFFDLFDAGDGVAQGVISIFTDIWPKGSRTSCRRAFNPGETIILGVAYLNLRPRFGDFLNELKELLHPSTRRVSHSDGRSIETMPERLSLYAHKKAWGDDSGLFVLTDKPISNMRFPRERDRFDLDAVFERGQRVPDESSESVSDEPRLRLLSRNIEIVFPETAEFGDDLASTKPM